MLSLIIQFPNDLAQEKIKIKISCEKVWQSQQKDGKYFENERKNPHLN